MNWSDIVFWLTIKPRMKRLQKLLPEAVIYPAGSRYVCSPPCLNTDVDFLVVTGSNVDDKLIKAKYVKSDFTSYFGQGCGDFWAWRRGVVNLIVTESSQYADAFIVATHLCKRFNVKDKYSRVVIHEALRGSEEVDIHYIGYLAIKGIIENFRVSPHRVTLIRAYIAKHGLKS